MSDYREERRADKALEADLRRQDKRLEVEAKLEAERLKADERRRDQEAADERRRKEQAEQRRLKKQAEKERAEKRAARNAKIRGVLSTRTVDIFVGLVMACALVPAFVSQASFLTQVGLALPLACLAAASVEGATWAFTSMAAQAEREHRPTARLRIGTWVCAVFAGVLNLAHWTETSGPVVGVFFGVLTPLATLLWDWRTHTSTRTKAERQRAAAEKKHEADRKRKFKDVQKRYEEILTAHPYGTVEEEAAWAQAWGDVKGSALAIDAKMLGRRIEAIRGVEEVAKAGEMTPEAFAVELLLADVFGSPQHGPEGPGEGLTGGGQGRTGTAVLDPDAGTSEGLGALGSKGQQPSRAQARKAADERPVEPGDIERVKALAAALGGTDKLSAKKVRETLGCAQAYAIRVRDAVRDEIDGEGPTTPQQDGK